MKVYFKDEVFEKIKGLHSEHRLINPTITLKDIMKENLLKDENKGESVPLKGEGKIHSFKRLFSGRPG